MEPLGWHLVLRPEQEQVLCADAAARRTFSGVVRRVGRKRGVFVFNAADTHAHVGTSGDRDTAGRLAHALEVSLGPALGL